MSVSERWSITPVEYEMTVKDAGGVSKNVRVDYQDLMVNVAEQRATLLEDEVAPLAKRVKARNQKLENIGFALSQLSSVSAQFNSEKPNPEVSNVTFDPKTTAIIAEVYKNAGMSAPSSLTTTSAHTVKKAEVDEATQKLKTWSERLNNDSQLNMSRMQQLVDGRDQSFNIATTMMNHISEARGFTIKSRN